MDTKVAAQLGFTRPEIEKLAEFTSDDLEAAFKRGERALARHAELQAELDRVELAIEEARTEIKEELMAYEDGDDL